MTKLTRGLLRVPIYLATFPVDLFMWALVLAIRVMWGQNLRWFRGCLWVEFRPGSFPIRKGKWPVGWYLMNPRRDGIPWGATSIGHGIFCSPGYYSKAGEPLTGLEAHELHHMRQAEAEQIAAALIAVFVWVTLLGLKAWTPAFWIPVAIWCLGGNLGVSAGGWIAAALRRDPRGFYRGSAHEVGAYAVEAEEERDPGSLTGQP